MSIYRFKCFAADETGATAIEYGLIAALVSVAIAGASMFLGGGISNTFRWQRRSRAPATRAFSVPTAAAPAPCREAEAEAGMRLLAPRAPPNRRRSGACAASRGSIERGGASPMWMGRGRSASGQMLLRKTIAVETSVVEVTNPKKARFSEGVLSGRL